MTAKQRKDRLDRLGYGLARNVRHFLTGQSVPYKTFPIRSGGPHNYFAMLAEVDRYILQVEQVRSWQDVDSQK